MALPADYSLRIKRLRGQHGLTQTQLADLLGVSFASINRWENGQAKPSALAWRTIERAEQLGIDGVNQQEDPKPLLQPLESDPPPLDFTADPEVLRTVAEGERLTYAFLFNSAFATETSLIDPLPHQRIAVYERMLKQPRLRFLLADDAGAGKTIMAGLYIREMLSRRLIRRVLVVPPAGLVGNWYRELSTLFSLTFKKVRGLDARDSNPFKGDDSAQIIVSVDTLAGDRVFGRLREPDVEPYDLIIFDEAHKLSARRDPDGTVRATDRYRLAEALAGATSNDPKWRLPWQTTHLLLLSATPHMGHDFPYFCLWRLLEPDVLTTPDAFAAYPPEARKRHFIRRTKEEMLTYEGERIYPTRQCDTLSYDLTPGDISEQSLYERTSEYLRDYYNKARILNRSAARLALSVFQRRLASSTWALLRSFERRIERLDRLIEDIRSGKISEEELQARQKKLDHDAPDVYEEKTGEEEESEDGREENETAEETAMGGVVAVTLNDLILERKQVHGLLDLARRIYELGEDAKFEKLKEFLKQPGAKEEKVLIFTEHRDTADFLVQQLGKIGFAGQVATIHGGLDYVQRDEQVEFFRKPVDEGGARYLIGTDAAGEGINLQFCGLMVNYDIPWNPARLEQRMGRIHRYGQKRNVVVIANLVAGKTREGRVLKTLLDKLERIRHSLGVDKVFDVIGRLFEGVSLSQYMERATDEKGMIAAVAEVEGRLTDDQVRAQQERERKLYGEGGDVGRQLPEERRKREDQEMRRLLPGYVQRFVERAAPLAGLRLEGDAREVFTLGASRSGVLDAFWELMERYPEGVRWRFSAHRMKDKDAAIFLRPGEPFFDRFRSEIFRRHARDAVRGAVFVDPIAVRPYLLHVLSVGVRREAAPDLQGLGKTAVLEQRLVGVRQEGEDAVVECPVEHLLLLRGREGVPPEAARLVAQASLLRDRAKAFALEGIARPLADTQRRRLLEDLPMREADVRTGFDYEESELAEQRQNAREKMEKGDAKAEVELQRVRERQVLLGQRRERKLAELKREPDLVVPMEPIFVANALVVPSTDPEDRLRHDVEVEAMAVKVAWQYEASCGGAVRDVSTCDKARTAGFSDYPGYDLHSKRLEGEERYIEVKGRGGDGDVEMTENEHEKAMTHREKYWLYVVFGCGTPHPRLIRIQDPAKTLVIRAKGSVIVEYRSMMEKGETD